MEKLIQNLKTVLGTTFTLYLKFHAAHWNIEGPFFESYHKLFNGIYDDLWQSVDVIAEQIRQLDAYAPGSLERFVELSKIKGTNEILPPNTLVVMLLKDIETLVSLTTEALHNAEKEDKQGLVNFLAGRVEMLSKWRWQLRATSKKIV